MMGVSNVHVQGIGPSDGYGRIDPFATLSANDRFCTQQGAEST